MFGALFNLIASSIPAEHKTSVWRVLVSLALIFFITWSLGMLPWGGFARAGEVAELADDVAELKSDFECSAIDAEIKRLRGELRENETKMFEARQQNNTDLIAHLEGVIADVSDSISDEVSRRNRMGCP